MIKMTNKEEKPVIYTTKIMIIDVYDHYSSDTLNQKPCVARYIGELIREDEIYYYLRHIKADLNMEDSALEYHSVMKIVVVRMKIIPITLEIKN